MPQPRRLAVGVLLVLYFLWPFVHQQLVLRYHINPWKLAGWGMYSTLPAGSELRFEGITGDGTRVELDGRVDPGLEAIAKRFLWYREHYGLFVEPSLVAGSLARSYPRHRWWVLTVDRVGLTGDGWVGSTHRSAYTYRRGSGGLELSEVSYPPAPGDGRISSKFPGIRLE